MGDKVDRQELEALEGEVLPERISMSLADIGATMIGWHGPSPPVMLPEPAQEDAALVDVMDADDQPES
jgi:hypothetical protein